jgi:hypothetical protein
MAERKHITSIEVITDSETSYDNIGDIDGGGMDKEWLKQHIRSHGPDGLFRVTAWMNFQIFEALREVNAEAESQKSAVGANKSPVPKQSTPFNP